MSNPYVVKTENFEGPLDLLLNLIETKKLQINTFSLSSITDNYLEKIKNLKDFPMEEVTKFIYVASLLILIKSKSLLPLLEYTQVEEGDIKSLESRIKLYKYVRNQAESIFLTWK